MKIIDDLLPYISDGIIIYDAQKTIIRTNNSVAGILNCTSGALENQALGSIFPDIEKIYTVNAGESITLDALIDGQKQPVYLCHAPLKDYPQGAGALILKHRAPQRPANSPTYREIHNFQELVMKNIPDLVFVKDEDLHIVTANPAFLEAYPENLRADVIGLDSKVGFHPDEADEFTAYDRLALKEGSVEYYETILFPDGKNRTLFTKKERFYDDAGRKYVLGIARDVTAMKKAEEEILRSNSELERFAYIAAHDMQEPLRIVSNFASLLESEYPDKLEGNALTYLQQCVKGAKRIQALVDDLLEYSRLGTEAEKPEKVNMNQIIKIVCENLHERIEKSGADIRIGDLGEIYGNPHRLMRVFQNIFGNALKYQPENNRPVIEISSEVKGNNRIYKIIDNGIGIAPKYFNTIFEPFKRLHGRNEYHGTGIGLAICKRIIENMGGQIQVKSEEGKGSEFIMIFPQTAITSE